MKVKLVLLAVMVTSLFLSGSTFAKVGDVNWDAFSQNLTKAIESGNKGLQQSAMCMIIRYADKVEIPRYTVFEIVRVFRSAEEKNERLLALVTLHKIEDPWAMDYLKRHRRFEKETRIKKLCCCSVKTYYAKQDSLKMDKTNKVLADAVDEIIGEYYTKAASQFELKEYGF